MNRIKTVVVLVVCMFCVVGAANALYFEDVVTDWGPGGRYDRALVPQYPHTLDYTHDINDTVDLSRYQVTDVVLELDFDWDFSDRAYFYWDNREYAFAAFDGSRWTYIDEVDNDIEMLVLGIDWLNDDGMLDVSLTVTNYLGTANAFLDWSRLSGNAEAVPEPATVLLLGFGFIGVAGICRKRKKS